MKSNYDLYCDHLRKLADVMFSSAVLQWDQETYMPSKGAEMRAGQLSTLAGIAHELSVDSTFGELLNKLKDDATLTERQKRNVELSLKDFNDRNKYTTEFVQTLSLAVSEAFVAWE